jgi:photosystem II stability/assembly factor-like uncharacterized protein
LKMKNRLWVATRKGLVSFTKTAAAARQGTWQQERVSFLGDAVSYVLPDSRTGRVYAALNLGHFGVKLHRTDDAGNSWREIAAPAYPPKPEGSDDPTAWTNSLIWCLAAGGADRPDEIWAGTLPGGLFHSTDAGETWQLNLPLWNRPERKAWFGGGYDQPGIHSIVVDPRDPNHVTVAVSCGGVWQTHDRGETWQVTTRGMRGVYMPPDQAEVPEVQDPHCVVASPANPDVLWCQHHNGIFVSEDAGHNWREIAAAGPSTFGFAVAVHPRDAATAWFVPALADAQRVPVDGQLVVTKTTDTGHSFHTLRNGLPQSGSFDLIYRHGLDVDASGTHLALGSTTGGLWISGDGGEQLAEVTHYLPPIACVRWQ